MLPELKQQLLAQWSNLPLDRCRPNQLGFLGVRTGLNDGYAFFLAFADQDRLPCFAIKIARGPTAELRLQHEWRILNRLQQHKLHLSGSSFPCPILAEVVSGVHILVTTAPLGQPMRASRNLPVEGFARVRDWLLQLASATRTTQPLATVRQSLEYTADRLRTTFELSNRETAIIESWITQYLAVAEDDQVVLFATHGNLRSQNIWWQRGQLTLVNWERGELADLPLHDMFTFTTTYHLPAVRRGSPERHLHAFQATYLTDGPYAELVSWTIASYCQALGLPLEDVMVHFGIFLIRAALEEYDQLLAAADRGYLPLLRDPNRLERLPYRQAIKDQLWINLLRLLIMERNRFESAIYPHKWKRAWPSLLQRRVVITDLEKAS